LLQERAAWLFRLDQVGFYGKHQQIVIRCFRSYHQFMRVPQLGLAMQLWPALQSRMNVV
jgi:hypothetical protein